MGHPNRQQNILLINIISYQKLMSEKLLTRLDFFTIEYLTEIVINNHNLKDKVGGKDKRPVYTSGLQTAFTQVCLESLQNACTLAIFIAENCENAGLNQTDIRYIRS